MNKTVVCFGETLWDVLPTGKQPGGAPFNVAVQLHQLSQPVQLISRVGTDDLGTELLAFLAGLGVSTTYVQRGHTHLTGVVKANVDNRNEVTYQIVQPVAWDYIQFEDALHQLVASSAVLVFGSLAARTETTRATLHRLLPAARFKVFDVNMRPPHYTRDEVEYLLVQSNLVKVNEHELAEILSWYGRGPAPDEASLAWLAQQFHLQAVCVTLGAEGAVLWHEGQYYRSPGLVVAVQDTIGSGDAFLAALLTSWLAGETPAQCVRFACAAGALVATYQGATPVLTRAQVAKFMAEQPA
jgi:fructokinase